MISQRRKRWIIFTNNACNGVLIFHSEFANENDHPADADAGVVTNPDRGRNREIARSTI